LAMVAIVTATGLSFVATSGVASASQYCYIGDYCLNAWGGGPDVKVYTIGVNNNNFGLAANGSAWNIKYQGGGAYNGYCISDYGNDSGNARAELISCGGGAGTPWGANFDLLNCNSGGYLGYVFNNIHWGAYLGPVSATVGQPFYLNKPTGWCMQID